MNELHKQEPRRAFLTKATQSVAAAFVAGRTHRARTRRSRATQSTTPARASASPPQLGRFRPLADFDWSWPQKIDRPLLERALSLEFIQAQRNLILLGANGVGKTMLAQNIAYTAVQAGYRVLFRTASEILTDLACDSPQLRRRKLPQLRAPRAAGD